MSRRRLDLTGIDDVAFFEAVYRETYSRTLAYALRRTANDADAHDVVAETYMVAWRRIEDLRKADLPQAWMYGIAYKVLGNARRAGSRREALMAKAYRYSPVAEASVDPASLVENQHEINHVCTAMSGLSPRDQEILHLAAFEELDSSEIAEALSVPAPLVRSMLYRARRRLNHALQTPPPRREPAAGHKEDGGEHQTGSRQRYQSG